MRCFEGSGVGLLKFLAVLLQKMLEEQRNFRRALAKRWNVDREHVQAVIEIFAESSGLHGFLHGHIRRRKNAHIHGDHAAPAQSRILIVLQHVQQLRLKVRAHLRDFVEERSCPCCACSNFPGFARTAPVNAPCS